MECPNCGVEIPDTTAATITLRDHYAEIAWKILLTREDTRDLMVDYLAKKAYAQADALLAKREKEREK